LANIDATGVGDALGEFGEKAGEEIGKTVLTGAKKTLGLIGVELDDVGKTIDAFGGIMEKSGKAADTAAASLAKLNSGVEEGTLDFEKMSTATDSLLEDFVVVGDGLLGISAEFGDLSSELNKTADATEKAGQELPDLFKTFKSGVLNFFDDLGASPEILGGVGVAFDQVSSKVVAGGENMSAAIEGAAEGFQAGGPIGALIGAIAALITKTEAFADILEFGEDTLGLVVKTLGKFLRPFVPLVETVNTLIQVLFTTILNLGFFETVVEGLGKVLGLVADGIAFVVEGIVSIFNIIIKNMAKLAKKLRLKGLAKRIRRSLIDLDDFSRDMESPQPTPEAPDIDPFRGLEEPSSNFGDSLDGLAETANEVAEALINVPRGFKIALRRFEATVAGAGAPGLGGPELVAAGGVTIQKMIVDTTDAQGFARMITDEQEFENFIRSGSSVQGTGDFSAEKGGA
jgi:hypothetical protein